MTPGLVPLPSESAPDAGANQPIAAPESGIARGRPWRPGESGNPRGRPVGGLSVATFIRELGGFDARVYVERLHAMAMDKRQPRLALEAIRILLERGFGRPPDMTVTFDVSALRDLSDADLEAALRVAERLTGG